MKINILTPLPVSFALYSLSANYFAPRKSAYNRMRLFGWMQIQILTCEQSRVFRVGWAQFCNHHP